MAERTVVMRRVEERLGIDLATAVPMLINEHGLVGAAECLGVSLPTLKLWLLRLGINVRCREKAQEA